MLITVCFLFSQWLETDFLKYLLDWEDSVSRRTDIEQQDKNKLMLSRETLEGVRITGKPALCTYTCRYNIHIIDLLCNRFKHKPLFFTVKSFIEMTKYLLPEEESDLFLLSEKVSQDPIENYFGRQRARGGRNENPILQKCVHNAAALRLQKSLSLDPVRGNCRRKRLNYSTEIIDSTPLPKRKRK